MSDEPSIDAWLDLWEELKERGETPDERAFLSEHCRNAPPEMIEEFRRKLRRLQRMDARIDQAARTDTVTGAAAGDTESPSKSPITKVLQPGFEPVKDYVLIAKLGSGGFGQVWKARGPGGHEAALKFVRLEKRIGAAEQRALDVMRGVRHPHLLSCHGSWQLGKWLIVAMDLADRTLFDRFREAVHQGNVGIPADELLGYIEEAAKGIDFLNEARHAGEGDTPIGIQHRDIKPQNLLLQGGGVKVADFGLAKFLEHSLTGHTGSMTPAYSAPEAFENKTSSRSDQYSLAVTYCQLRGGRLPFDGSPFEIMLGHREREPDLSMLPPRERPVVARALAKNPKDRWSSCREFASALRSAGMDRRAPTSMPGTPMGTGSTASKSIWSNRRIVAGIGGAAVMLLVIPVLLTITGGESEPAARTADLVAATAAGPISPVENAAEAETAGEVGRGEPAPKRPVEAETNEDVDVATVPDDKDSSSEPAESDRSPDAASMAATSTSPTSPTPVSDPSYPPTARVGEGQPADSRAEFVPLFNGRDLSGWEEVRTETPAGGDESRWRHEPGAGMWEARDGEIVSVAGAGHRGFLRTTQTYTDFVLRLEFRIAPGGNSGVLVRCPDIRQGVMSTAGVEAQIIDDHSPKRRTPAGVGHTGTIWKVSGPAARTLRPDGAWNVMEIRCEGDHIRVSVNGQRTADVDMAEEPALRGRPRAGFIALATEGATVAGPWFRNVELLDLAARPEQRPTAALGFRPLFDGKSLTGWQEYRTQTFTDRPKVGGRYPVRHSSTSGDWKVDDGMLVSAPPDRSLAGFLRTTEEYADFVLRFSFRLSPENHGGVVLRCPEIDGIAEEQLDLAGLEIRIVDDYETKSGEKDPTEWRTGRLHNTIGPDRSLLRPDGAWNTMEIHCVDTRLKAIVNGETAFDIDRSEWPTLRDRPRSGGIAFKLGQWAEGGVGPWYKDVEIAELPSTSAGP